MAGTAVLALAAGVAGAGVTGACERPPGDAARASERDARPPSEVTQARETLAAGAPHVQPHGQHTAGASSPTPVPPPSSVPAPAAADEPPHMLNPAPPFSYPRALFPRRVQGNVTLRLWVDSAGHVRAESTRVAESSGVRLLDSAAVAGSPRLRFAPARHGGRPVAAPLLFPVHFRHPAAGPLPGDAGARR